MQRCLQDGIAATEKAETALDFLGCGEITKFPGKYRYQNPPSTSLLIMPIYEKNEKMIIFKIFVLSTTCVFRKCGPRTHHEDEDLLLLCRTTTTTTADIIVERMGPPDVDTRT